MLVCRRADPSASRPFVLAYLYDDGAGSPSILFHSLSPRAGPEEAIGKATLRYEKRGPRSAMGIIGTVAKIQDDTVVVRMYDGTKLEFLKAAITDVTPGSDESANEG